MHRLWTLLLSFALSVSLTGCGGEPRSPAVPAEVPGLQQTETAAPVTTDGIQDTAIDWNNLSYSYTTQELPAEVDGHAIYGEIYIPDGAGEPMPAVIFSHGYGGTHSWKLPDLSGLRPPLPAESGSAQHPGEKSQRPLP